ncbi:phycobilisome linker polypeptide, partial [Enterococcus faecalis]
QRISRLGGKIVKIETLTAAE